jgi:hypothetical protein
MYPGCKNLADFIQCYYGSVLSLQAVGENDLYTISGLDSSTTSFNSLGSNWWR